MELFNTYKEAVISNGSTNGICKNKITGEFLYLVDELTGMWADWVECNPADHLETLESFLASGKLLGRGDVIVDSSGDVMRIDFPSVMNCRDDENSRSFILQAAADQVETPEEKEAFEVMTSKLDAVISENHSSIDTTPQQVESLGGSEKPNKSEWRPEVGEKVRTTYEVGEVKAIMMQAHSHVDYVVQFEDDWNIFTLDELSKPETPAESEQRDRLEAAYDLYCVAVRSDGDDPHSFKNWRKMTCSVKANLAIVDKTGYRKQ